VTSSSEYQKNINWLRHALNFPYNKIKKLPVDISDIDNDLKCEKIKNYISNIYTKLDNYIYGIENVKEELMSFICKKISNPKSINHVLALQGSNGVGKTRLVHGLATVLDLPIRIINLGCVSDSTYFSGHSFTYQDSDIGRIASILIETQSKNCIIYFDELDKIHKTEKALSINSFITHLIDKSQNTKYQDTYLAGLDLDLSQVFFIFSFNKEELLDTTVKDRLKIINIPDPSTEDKINIVKKFIIPEICTNINYPFTFNTNVVEDIIKNKCNDYGLLKISQIFEDVIGKFNLIRFLDNEKKMKMTFYHSDIDIMIQNIVKTHNKNDDISHLNMYM
jgi:ATP-dependent Lon protease